MECSEENVQQVALWPLEFSSLESSRQSFQQVVELISQSPPHRDVIEFKDHKAHESCVH